MNVVLIGFMGSGKSSIGHKLADQLGRDFIDTDDLIEKRANKSIREIFEEKGEEVFRQIEAQIVAEVSQGEDAVIACGGGVILNPRNVEFLKKKGKIFYLKGDPELLYERVKNSKERPLLDVEMPEQEFRRLFDKRRGRYEASADETVEIAGKSEGQIAQEIAKMFEGRS